ncbi:uncharacterized protein LOC127857732 [Dreissena polymorpha]|nr:uncharacterized protein LOC127857732 [Dreissena polymorpha]
MKASRMSLPLPVPVPKGRTEVAAHAGSCTIPGFHECTDDNIMYSQPVLKTCPFKSKMKRSQNLDFRSLQNGLTGNDILSKYRARSPSVDAYDTDISRSPSPVIDNSINESFHLGFIYEDTIDDLLETSTIVRDDTFESLKDQTKPKEDPNQDRNSPLLESKYHRLYYPVEKDLSPSPSAPSCSISEKLETTFDESVTQNMQASIDTGYASGTPHDIDSDSMSSSGDLDTIPDHVSEVELEWDNDPSTHTLLADSPIANNLTSQVKPPYLMSHKNITEIDIACVKNEGTHNAMVDLYCVTHKFEDKNNENYVQCTFTIPRKHQNPQVSVGSKKYRRRSRSLADLDLTLEEKVIMLREEKAMVQRKIQDSILEDRKRRYEIDKNKSEKAEYKSEKAESKTLLWKTLQDLKTRLEGQSERLQSSYQAIQTLRARFTPRRQTLTVMETHV